MPVRPLLLACAGGAAFGVAILSPTAPSPDPSPAAPAPPPAPVVVGDATGPCGARVDPRVLDIMTDEMGLEDWVAACRAALSSD